MTPEHVSTVIQQGQAVAFFAFDVGYEISLDQVRTLLQSLPVSPLSRKKQTPNYMQYAKSPQVVYLGKAEPILGDVSGEIHATLFDFGAISISYRWPLGEEHQTPLLLNGLPRLSQQLYESTLEGDARQQVEALLKKIEPAVTRPELSPLVEDFFVFILEAMEPPFAAETFLSDNRSILAQTLRFDTEALSHEQQEEALSKAISYYTRDLVLIDWNTAIICDADYSDTMNVLEFLNVELLEARTMDAHLDKRIQEYEGLLKRDPSLFTSLYSPYRNVMAELAELRIESSLLAERIDNALKLIGDLYLARIHKAASERFYLHEWDTAISRKLDIIGHFYQLLSDRVATSQAHTLEVIIILLIVIEILLGFFVR